MSAVPITDIPLYILMFFIGAILLNHQILKSAKTKVVCMYILPKISPSWQVPFFKTAYR